MKQSPRVNEGIPVQDVHSCLLCGKQGLSLYQGLRDQLFAAPGNWQLWRCSACGLIWLNPRPLPEAVGKLYERYYTHETRNTGSTWEGLKGVVWSSIVAAHLGYQGLKGSAPRKLLGKLLSWVGPVRERVELSVMNLEAPPKRLLDVGCGNGLFLSRMRSLGWEGVGVEPDGLAAKVARVRFGHEVFNGTLEEAGFPSDSFDAITMCHVIEHVPDPIAALQECCRILKANGKLVVVTPNIDSLGHKVFREAWFGLEVPRHLHLFLPRTLLAIADRAKLQVLQLRTTARTASRMWAASRLNRENQHLSTSRLYREGLVFQAMERVLCLAKHAGEELVMTATKYAPKQPQIERLCTHRSQQVGLPLSR